MTLQEEAALEEDEGFLVAAHADSHSGLGTARHQSFGLGLAVAREMRGSTSRAEVVRSS